MSVIDARPTLNAPDDDPYLWLEDIDGEKALIWVTEQSARTLSRFGGPPFEGDRDTLAGIFDCPDKIAGITRRDRYLYNFWRDAENPRGVWRRTTLAAYMAAEPEWEIVLDVDALAKAEGKD
ncbi:prolyl oligopeptidase PreP (S9A serine peptidase family) [Rhizobium leucaenae]|nr:prolyl oligopeptidase PreP (S9A serine peptidase family) [Rhizobium leucaenae]